MSRRTIVIAVVMAVLGGGALAYSAIPHSTTRTITACYSTTNGALRVIDREAGATCTSSERLLEWNQRGMRWRGTWLSTVDYGPNDGVTYQGSAYIVQRDPAAGTAPTNRTYWGVLAEKGAPGLNWRGAYSSATAYAVNDAVTYAGSSFRAKVATTGASPTDSTKWDIIASKGATGAPGMSGGRTAEGPGTSVTNCRDTTVASREVTANTTQRLFADAQAIFTGDANNYRTATFSIQLRSQDGSTLYAMTPSHNAFYRPDGAIDVRTAGILTTTSGEPFALVPGTTYSLVARIYPYGSCGQSTSVTTASLTYLRVGNAD